MTPKEKGKELVEMFIGFASDEDTTEDGFVYSEEIRLWKAKQCALIAVDEILLLCPFETYRETLSPYDGAELSTKYWQEVRHEIENL
jgi:hypothetical protein